MRQIPRYYRKYRYRVALYPQPDTVCTASNEMVYTWRIERFWNPSIHPSELRICPRDDTLDRAQTDTTRQTEPLSEADRQRDVKMMTLAADTRERRSANQRRIIKDCRRPSVALSTWGV